MTPALLLVDLQQDFLDASGLEPPAGDLIARAADLLAGCRRAAMPIVHVWTTVRRDDDRRMPHWRARDLWRCEEGTPGHAPPASLRPRDGEAIVHKTDFSAFGDEVLDGLLGARGVDTVIVAGVHTHACVRATVLDAYARRLCVWVADDAVGSDEPLHAAAARRWLMVRAATFMPVEAILSAVGDESRREPEGLALRVEHGAVAAGGDAGALPASIVGDVEEHDAAHTLPHEAPAATGHVLFRTAVAGPVTVARAVAAARAAAPLWADEPVAERRALLERLATLVDADAAALTDRIVDDVGKPIAQARDEVARTVALLRAVAARGADDGERRCGPASWRRDRPLGVVALVTPWNNPLAIPLGKLAPALMYGNAVVWKPALPATAIARRVMTLLHAAGAPAGTVVLCSGDASTATAVMHGDVDGVALTGGAAAGWAAQLACAQRRVPLQAELGGNNAALIAADADLHEAARLVAAGAFEFAGQRCTANRRVIVERACLVPFTAALVEATMALAWGRPRDEATRVGPLLGAAARLRVARTIERALAEGAVALGPPADAWPSHATLSTEGAYLPPAILACDRPDAAIVQEETFGPVLVVQPASDWTDALRLLNGVPQGLVAAAFTDDAHRRDAFLCAARAGILKLGTSTAGADVEAPFGGWKQSGVGPPEHGESNRDFYTRPQAVYR